MTDTPNPERDIVPHLLVVADEIREADADAIAEGHEPNKWRWRCENACRQAVDEVVRLRAELDTARAERDSLRLERDAMEHVRRKDIAHLLAERDKLTAALRGLWDYCDLHDDEQYHHSLAGLDSDLCAHCFEPWPCEVSKWMAAARAVLHETEDTP